MGLRAAFGAVGRSARQIPRLLRAVWVFFAERRPEQKPDQPLVVKLVYPGGAATKDYSFPLRTVWKAKIAVGVVFVLFFVGIFAMGDATWSRWKLRHLRKSLAEFEHQEQVTQEMQKQLAEIWVINERLQRMLGRRAQYREKPTTIEDLPQGVPVSRWLGVAFGVPKSLPENLRDCLRCAPGSLVLATADGKVTGISWDPDYGDVVTIDYGEGINARYGRDVHFLVEEGELVRKAQPIGVVHAPDSSSMPLLYYAVSADGAEVETIPYMVFGGASGIHTE